MGHHEVDLLCTRCGHRFVREITAGQSTYEVKCPGYCDAVGEAVVVFGASTPILVFVHGSEVVPTMSSAVTPSLR